MRDCIFISDKPLETPENGFDFVYTYSKEGDKVLHLIRSEIDDLAIEDLTLLAHVENNQYVFTSADNQDIYESTREVGAHAVKEIYTDENGSEYSIEKPYMFGLFA